VQRNPRLYDNVFVGDFCVSSAQNKSQSRLTPSFVLQLPPCFDVDKHTQAVLEIPKRRHLLLVSTKKLDHNWLFAAFGEPDPTELSRRNSENVQNSTSDKK